VAYKNKQSGYLLEIPIIMLAVGMLLTFLLPVLPDIIRKIVVIISALVWIAGSYYMIVTPGWQPGNNSRLRYPWSLVVFIIFAALLAFTTAAYVFS
jgi:hypothetical protein